jgi:glycosyltransferase involved in cell wall biosynthesis
VQLKVLHLAAGNRWTGAAAPAFAEVEALRAAGVDAHYAYVGGYKLEAKIGHHDFAHAAIEKAQNPFSFRRSLANLTRLIDRHGFDVLHAHLTYDHWLARFAARGRGLRLARTFHARRVLRGDPFTRSLIRATAHRFVINDAFRDALPGSVFTPPPLDLEQFSPDGANVRAQYGIAPETWLVTVIGKLSKNRGFEEALRTFAVMQRERRDARLMIIGHGEHRPALERLAASLDVAPLWAGYHEVDLAEHYRASDLLLFTARGSDEGHRAILEAMACGVPPVSYPIEGVSALVDDARLVARDATPESLARSAVAILDDAALRRQVAGRARGFGYARAAGRLLEAYSAPV